MEFAFDMALFELPVSLLTHQCLKSENFSQPLATKFTHSDQFISPELELLAWKDEKSLIGEVFGRRKAWVAGKVTLSELNLIASLMLNSGKVMTFFFL